jgi:hypothetical protein
MSCDWITQKYFHGIYFGKNSGHTMYSNEKRSEDDNHSKTAEITKIKKEIEFADKIFYDELASKYFVLEKFSLEQLREMCNNLLGKGPDVEYFLDERTNKTTELPQYKEDFIHFIIDEFQYSEIKDYALQKQIIPSYFFENSK